MPRAQREVAHLALHTAEVALVALSRLADLLFVMARYINKLNGMEETKWNGTTMSD